MQTKGGRRGFSAGGNGLDVSRGVAKYFFHVRDSNAWGFAFAIVNEGQLHMMANGRGHDRIDQTRPSVTRMAVEFGNDIAGLNACIVSGTSRADVFDDHAVGNAEFP